MYAAGELVVYGGEGVCRVEGVGAPSLPGMDKTRLYYTLSPLYRSGQVMTPVDTQVLMRPLLTAEETAQLIAELDQLPEEQAESHSMRAIKDLYHQVLTSYDCRRLAGLIKGVCRRRSWAVHHGRKISQMDERYLKRAEDALYGELGAVLGLPREEVPAYIRKTWPNGRYSDEKVVRRPRIACGAFFMRRNHKAENRKPVLRLNGRKIDEKSFLSLASIEYPRDVTKVHV